MVNQTMLTRISEEAIRENLIISFDSQDKESILQTVESSVRGFYLSMSIIEELISSPGTDDSDKAFIVLLLQAFVSKFEIPAIMTMENTDFLQPIISYYNETKDQQVVRLLEMCLAAIPSQSQKEAVPLLIDEYQKMSECERIPAGRASTTPFCELFNNIYKILALNQTSMEQEEIHDILTVMTKTVLGEIESSGSAFKTLEQDLLRNYQSQLQGVLDTIEREQEREKEETKKAKQMKETYKAVLQTIPQNEQIRNRVSFVKGESLFFQESEEIEYKEYTFPFTEQLEKTISRVVCSFLNNKGGRIYIGVSDDKIVKGIKLTRQQREDLIHTINHRCIASFEPEILDKDFLQILFLPILNSQTSRVIPGLFVVKIIVKQGEPTLLYSTVKEVLQCYVRRDDQSKILQAKETRELIIERYLNPIARVPEEMFVDPEPEKIIDIESPRSHECSNKKKARVKMEPDNYEPVNFGGFYENEGPSLTVDTRLTSRKNRGYVTIRPSFYGENEFKTDDQNNEESPMSETTIEYSTGCDLDQSSFKEDFEANFKGTTPISTSKYESSNGESRTTSDFDQSQPDWDRLAIKNDFDSDCQDKSRSFNKAARDRIKTEQLPNPANDLRGNILMGGPIRNSFEPNFNRRNRLGAANLNSSKNSNYLNVQNEAKKRSPKQDGGSGSGKKEYYSNILDNINTMQIKGKNPVKVYEVFIEGLPTIWAQEDFDQFQAALGMKSIFSSRMFKKDTGFCNGKAFLNFTDEEEAKQFVASHNKTLLYDKALMVKFK